MTTAGPKYKRRPVNDKVRRSSRPAIGAKLSLSSALRALLRASALARRQMPRRHLPGALAAAANAARVIAPALGGVAVGVLVVLQLQELRQRRKGRRSRRRAPLVSSIALDKAV